MVKGDDPFHLGTSSLKHCLQKMLHFRIVNLSRFPGESEKGCFLFGALFKKKTWTSLRRCNKKKTATFMATRVDDTWWTTLTIQVLTPCSLHHVQSFESLAMDWPKKDPLKNSNSEKFNLPALTDFIKQTYTHDCMYKCISIKETMWTAIIFASGLRQGEHWSIVFLFQTSKLKTLTGFSQFEGIPKPSQHSWQSKTRMLLGLLVGTCKSWNPAVFQDASVKRAFWISTSVVSQMSQRSSKVVDFGQMYRPTRFPGMIRWYSSFARIW